MALDQPRKRARVKAPDGVDVAEDRRRVSSAGLGGPIAAAAAAAAARVASARAHSGVGSATGSVPGKTQATAGTADTKNTSNSHAGISETDKTATAASFANAQIDGKTSCSDGAGTISADATATAAPGSSTAEPAPPVNTVVAGPSASVASGAPTVGAVSGAATSVGSAASASTNAQSAAAPAAGVSVPPVNPGSVPATGSSTTPHGAGTPTVGGSVQVPFFRLSSRCRPSMNISQLVYLDKDELTFGRLPTCDVVLDSSRVPAMISRVHGRATRTRKHREASEGGPAEDDGEIEYRILDNRSLNGVSVNGEPVSPEGRVLCTGDIVLFGRVVPIPEFEFVFEGPPPLQAASASPPLAPPTHAVAAPAAPSPPVATTGAASSSSAALAAPSTAPAPPSVEALFGDQMRRIAELQKELETEREQKRVESQKRQATRSDFTEVHSELVCSVCQDWLVHASTIECSHTYCWTCIEEWLLQKKFECPVCRHAVTREPIRTRQLDCIVQTAVSKLGEKQGEELSKRVAAAEQAAKKKKDLHAKLEKTVSEALKSGKAFFSIDSRWSKKERKVFHTNVKEYTGATRAVYCRLTGLTAQWVHSADDSKLNQALHNLELPDFINKKETEIRQRLLMYLGYG